MLFTQSSIFRILQFVSLDQSTKPLNPMDVSVKTNSERDDLLKRRSMLRHLLYQAVPIGVGTLLYPNTTSAAKANYSNNSLDCKNTSPATEIPKSLATNLKQLGPLQGPDQNGV